MSKTNKQNISETFNINAEKIYDWIVGDATGSTNILVGDLPIALPANATNVDANCILTDEDGDPIPVNTVVDIEEITPRQDRQVDRQGEIITLQRVRFRKTLYAVLEVSGVNPGTGNLFLITSDPIPFNFVETAFLCAPEGTTISVRISDFSCLAVINRDDTGAITDFDIELFTCQSIQSITPISINVPADLSTPREELVEQCGAPISPPQCNTVFPD
ncbi:MAG TPA: hypothetical protein VK087_02150 [Tissierellaceae bacterium]|nr:hypothetical protein [Tissierellaceae bacterium]